jgi:hypothetical protein
MRLLVVEIEMAEEATGSIVGWERSTSVETQGLEG